MCRNLTESLVLLVIQKTLLTAWSYAGLGKVVLRVWLYLASCYHALGIVTRQKCCRMNEMIMVLLLGAGGLLRDWWSVWERGGPCDGWRNLAS